MSPVSLLRGECMSSFCILSIKYWGILNLTFIALLLLKRITFSYVYKCWPKTNSKYFSSKDGLIQDQQRIASQALHPWWVEVHPCTSPSRQEKKTFYGEGKEGEKAGINKEFVAFHWLSPCQERRGVFLFPVELCYCHTVWELPALVSQLYLTEVSAY